MEEVIRDNKKRGKKPQGPRVNDKITASEVRLISDEGEEFGIVTLSSAIGIAEEKNLDLVEVSPNAKPPVVKIIDYGKYKYLAQKKANEAKKKTVTVQLKEIQFRPNIDQHDLEVKLKRAEKFLAQGDKIKMVMQFRGREMAYRDSGFEKFRNLIKTVEEIGAIIESEPKMMGNRIITIVSPSKKQTSKPEKPEKVERAPAPATKDA
jgi:translation initiation factor IF-3